MDDSQRHRSWIFVINNPTPQDFNVTNSFMKTAAYGIYGNERGNQTQTPHIQAYVRLKSAITFKKMKWWFPRAHIEVARGTDKDNQAYCSKEGDFKEFGTISEGQGTRTDIKTVAQLIKNHEITMEEVMFEYPELYVKYSRSLEKMFAAVQPHREDPPQVFWRWGLAGVGKTRQVIDEFGPENVYIKDNTSWWDNYHQQEVILIDDFDNQIPYRTLLRILDRYRYQGQIKGGYVNINSPFIIITCEFPPDHFWSGNTLAQVTRRLTSVQEIK